MWFLMCLGVFSLCSFFLFFIVIFKFDSSCGTFVFTWSSIWDCISNFTLKAWKISGLMQKECKGCLILSSLWIIFPTSFLFFPFICRSPMILQSISMKTTQNVQVTHQDKLTAVFLLWQNLLLFFIVSPEHFSKCFLKKAVLKPNRFKKP